MRSRPSLNVFGVVEDIGCIIGEVLDFVGGVPSTVWPVGFRWEN